MFKLSEAQLDLGFNAIQYHGYGSFFPQPPEFQIIINSWDSVRTHLANLDLDTYQCYVPLNAFVPKSRLNVRWVSLLHPFDLIIYTSLVMAIRDDIARARLPIQSRRVFSFRTEGAPAVGLYKFNSAGDFIAFRELQRKKVRSRENRFIGIADIGDFYPRIYHHRLTNALDTIVDPSKRDILRALRKLLSQFSNGVSYGIPVGPAASRPLGEAILIDVDSALKARKSDFIRFVDDFVFFAKTQEAAEANLHFLGETLFTNHGLTLQTAKTNVYSSSDYIEEHLTEHSEKETKRRKLLRLVHGEGYQIKPYEQLTPRERTEFDAFNLSDMLEDALEPEKPVDYSEVSFILSRLSALRQPDLIPIVLQNLHRLYPVAHSINAFFEDFTDLPTSEKKRIAKKLLQPLLKKRGPKPPIYYAIWILNLFYKKTDWDHADDLLQMFNSSPSPTVQRYAALALSVSGARPHALGVKDHINSAPPLLRTAILLATKKLGADERRFWLERLRLDDQLEKCIS